MSRLPNQYYVLGFVDSLKEGNPRLDLYDAALEVCDFKIGVLLSKVDMIIRQNPLCQEHPVISSWVAANARAHQPPLMENMTPELEARARAWEAAAMDDDAQLRRELEKDDEDGGGMATALYRPYTLGSGDANSPSAVTLPYQCVASLCATAGPDIRPDPMAMGEVHAVKADFPGDALLVAMEYGCDVNAPCEPAETHGWNAVHLAAARGYTELLVMMFRDARPRPNVHFKNPRGRTPLDLAAYYGHVKSVELLLKRGAIADSVSYEGTSTLEQVRKCIGISSRHPDLFFPAEPGVVDIGRCLELLECAERGEAGGARAVMYRYGRNVTNACDCEGCDSPSAELGCGRCELARYCDRACQKRDYAKHKRVCAEVAEVKQFLLMTERHGDVISASMVGRALGARRDLVALLPRANVMDALLQLRKPEADHGGHIPTAGCDAPYYALLNLLYPSLDGILPGGSPLRPGYGLVDERLLCDFVNRGGATTLAQFVLHNLQTLSASWETWTVNSEGIVTYSLKHLRLLNCAVGATCKVSALARSRDPLSMLDLFQFIQTQYDPVYAGETTNMNLQIEGMMAAAWCFYDCPDDIFDRVWNATNKSAMYHSTFTSELPGFCEYFCAVVLSSKDRYLKALADMIRACGLTQKDAHMEVMMTFVAPIVMDQIDTQHSKEGLSFYSCCMYATTRLCEYHGVDRIARILHDNIPTDRWADLTRPDCPPTTRLMPIIDTRYSLYKGVHLPGSQYPSPDDYNEIRPSHTRVLLPCFSDDDNYSDATVFAEEIVEEMLRLRSNPRRAEMMDYDLARERVNDMFREGRILEACRGYSQLLRHLDDNFEQSPDIAYRRALTLSNRAMCLIRLCRECISATPPRGSAAQDYALQAAEHCHKAQEEAYLAGSVPEWPSAREKIAARLNLANDLYKQASQLVSDQPTPPQHHSEPRRATKKKKKNKKKSKKAAAPNSNDEPIRPGLDEDKTAWTADPSPGASTGAVEDVPASSADASGAEDSNSDDDGGDVGAQGEAQPEPCGTNEVAAVTVGSQLAKLKCAFNEDHCPSCYLQFDTDLAYSLVVVRRCSEYGGHVVCAQCFHNMSVATNVDSESTLAARCLFCRRGSMMTEGALSAEEVATMVRDVACLAIPHLKFLCEHTNALKRMVRDLDVEAFLTELLLSHQLDPDRAYGALFDFIGSAILRPSSDQGGQNASTRRTASENSRIYTEARQQVREMEEELAAKQKQLTDVMSELAPKNEARVREDIRSLRARIDEARQDAMRAILEAQNTPERGLGGIDSQGVMKVDFHGLHTDEVQRMLNETLIPIVLPSVTRIDVIVGKGKHSRDGAVRLRAVVEATVDGRWNDRAQWTMDPHNHGILQIHPKRR